MPLYSLEEFWRQTVFAGGMWRDRANRFSTACCDIFTTKSENYASCLPDCN